MDKTHPTEIRKFYHRINQEISEYLLADHHPLAEEYNLDFLSNLHKMVMKRTKGDTEDDVRKWIDNLKIEG